MPSSGKPLPETMLTEIYDAIQCHKQGCNELTTTGIKKKPILLELCNMVYTVHIPVRIYAISCNSVQNFVL